jgi:hypothetical protein
MITKTRGLAAVLGLLATLPTSAAFAGTATLELTRTVLSNVTDTAGLYQYETGTVSTSTGAPVGYYNVTRRVISGGAASALNAANETMNVILATTTPGPFNNLTLEGTHDFTSGAFAGSVSAAAAKYSFAITGTATAQSGTVTTLVVTFKGSHSIP